MHSIVVEWITVGFLVRTRFSMTGESWMCVSQLLGPETKVTLDGRSMVKDRDLRNDLAMQGKREVRVGVARTEYV
jgi:hypothetical protein